MSEERGLLFLLNIADSYVQHRVGCGEYDRFAPCTCGLDSWREQVAKLTCDHDGQLVEVPELGEVRCERCGEMAPTAEKHFRVPFVPFDAARQATRTRR